MVGLAKQFELVFTEGNPEPVVLPRHSQALYLIQRIRDEAHRFAITFHRKKRGQAMTRSALDSIPGLGPAKQKALLKSFGSVAKIREATAEELCAVPGIGPAMAEVIRENLVETPS